MKAFDEYYDNTNDSICSCGGGFIPARDVWKAALKWLLTQPLCRHSSDIVKRELEGNDEVPLGC